MDDGAMSSYLDELIPAYCGWLVSCGEAEEQASCEGEVGPELREELLGCAAVDRFYVDNKTDLDGCLGGSRPSCGADDLDDFCPKLGEIDPLLHECKVGTGGPSGEMNLAARAVGGWVTEDTGCPSSEDFEFAMFLCPGGHARGAGKMGNATELMCGSYSTSPASLPDCDDRWGCFDKISIQYASTLILGGQEDVNPSAQLELRQIGPNQLIRAWSCGGEDITVIYDRVDGEVGDMECVSDACGSGSAESGMGQCGTDCDCGPCWYCDGGTCRYGGTGPYGCYRGCPWAN